MRVGVLLAASSGHVRIFLKTSVDFFPATQFPYLEANQQHQHIGDSMNPQPEFFVEKLETRQMMAGDVSVRVTNGNLVVTGDNQDNEIYVFQTDDQSYTLFGENGTRINGLSGMPFTGVTNDLRMNLRNGDNKLAILGMDAGDDVTIRTGRGNDTIILESVTIRSDLRIRSSRGDDTIFLMENVVHGATHVNMAGGDDEFVSHKSTFVQSTVNTGSGNDEFYLRDVTLHQPSDFKLGAGEDLAWFGFTPNEESNLHLLLDGGRGNDVYGHYLALDDPISNFEAEGISIDDFAVNVDFNNNTIEAELNLSISS